MTQSAQRPSLQAPGLVEKVDLLRWHLDRYDRLRASTATRASVVLSAGAILSAGSAVVLSRLLASPDPLLDARLAALFGAGLLISIGLVVLSLVRASGVLVTLKSSRESVADGDALPRGLIFNGTDTVAMIPTFQDFRATVAAQDYTAILEAAQVELWVVIQQHRLRYGRLRAAVRALRWAALTFLVSSACLVGTVLLTAL